METLQDNIESLQFWHARARRLPWYRMRARREAREMAARWERRITAAMLSQRGISLRARGQAAVLVGAARLQRLRLGRWLRLAAVSVMLVLAIPFLLLAVLLVQIF